MEIITKFFESLDPAALLPNLENALGKVEQLLRLAVMVGPLALLVLGLLYLLLPPREATHSFGYQFFWGKSSVEAWRFTQRVAGLAWALLGLVLTIVMYFASAGFPGMATMDMVWSAVKCVLWELGLSVLACIAIDVVVILFYDSHGVRRELGKKK